MAASLGNHAFICQRRCLVYLYRYNTVMRLKDVSNTNQQLAYMSVKHGGKNCGLSPATDSDTVDPNLSDRRGDPTEPKHEDLDWKTYRERIRNRYGLAEYGSSFRAALEKDEPENDQEAEIDFFGINTSASSGDESCQLRKPLRRRVTDEHIRKTFRYLENPKPAAKFEKVYSAPFGTIRLDKDNKPRYHGQMEQPVEQPIREVDDTETGADIPPEGICLEKITYDTGQVIHDREKFSGSESSQVTGQIPLPNDKVTHEYQVINSLHDKLNHEASNRHAAMQVEENIIDEQYFPEIVQQKGQCIAKLNIQTDEVENVFDEQYFPDLTKEGKYSASMEESVSGKVKDSLKLPFEENESDLANEKKKVTASSSSNKDKFSDMSETDEIFFGKPSEPNPWSLPELAENIQEKKVFSKHNISLEKDSNSDGTLSDGQSVSGSPLSDVDWLEPVESKIVKRDDSLGDDMFGASLGGSNSFGNMKTSSNIKDDGVERYPEVEVDNRKTVYITSEPPRKSKKANLDKPVKAYDVAMKIRLEIDGKIDPDQPRVFTTQDKTLLPRLKKWAGKVDSKGFRILKDQVVDLQNMPEDDVVAMLRRSILYEDDEIVAIDKPYGLPSHGGPGIHHSIGKLLPKLAHRLDKKAENLQLIHRLDKETTGVMVLARNEAVAWKLHGMFKRREVVKKYWVLTKGVPNPLEGLIDIPMAEGKLANKYRMALRPVNSPETKMMSHRRSYKSTFDAITNYKVLDSYNSCALVECHPETGVKHQIRCHLAFGLNTPILGDHKYSHFSKLAPQKLPPDMLQRLHLRQPLVRYLAMHLHAKVLILPEARNGRNLFISAPLPRHFIQNMKWLKLSPPSHIKY